MPQVTAISINDGSTTPVAVSYTLESIGNGVASFVDRRKTSRSLQPSFRVGFSPATAARKTMKPSVEVEYPVEGLVNGVAAVVDVARFRNGSFTIPEGMTNQDIKHFHALCAGLLTNTSVKTVIINGEPFYS